MYLFPFTKKEKFLLKKTKEETALQSEEHKIKYLLKPCDLDTNFFVITNDEKGKFTINDTSFTIKKATMCCTTLQLKENEEAKTNENFTMETLIDSFGNKKAKKRYQSYKDKEKKVPEPKMIYTYEEQIVPAFNSDAKDVSDIYDINDIFGAEVVEDLKGSKLKFKNLHESIQKSYEAAYKVEFILLDCIIKILEWQKVNASRLGSFLIVDFESVNDFFALFVDGKYLTDKSKDKLAMIAYVLLLTINNYKVKYENVIKLKYDKEKIIMMFKSLGCAYNANSGVFSLTKPPVTEVMQKRRKRAN